MWLLFLMGADCGRDKKAVEAFVEFDGAVVLDGDLVELEGTVVGQASAHTVEQFCLTQSISVAGISVEALDGVQASITPTLTFPIFISDSMGLGLDPRTHFESFPWTVTFTPTEDDWSADVFIDAGQHSTRFTVVSVEEALVQDTDGDGVPDDEDCDFGDPDVYPGAPEPCNRVDDDCDGQIDEDTPTAVYYPDFDGDGYGDPNGAVETCEPSPDDVTDGTDCDDTRANVNPGAVDAAGDGVDADCDGVDCTVGALGDTRFGICTGTFDWAQSRDLCAIAFDDIASVRSADEQAFLLSLMAQAELPFALIGFTDAEDEGVFRWADGSGIGYTAWADGEPNDTNNDEDCSAIQGSAGYGWNDVPCSLVTSVVACQDRP